MKYFNQLISIVLVMYDNQYTVCQFFCFIFTQKNKEYLLNNSESCSYSSNSYSFQHKMKIFWSLKEIKRFLYLVMADILDGGWGCVGGYIFYRGPPNDPCTQVFLYDFGEEI